jgi:hypothetical protein
LAKVRLSASRLKKRHKLKSRPVNVANSKPKSAASNAKKIRRKPVNSLFKNAKKPKKPPFKKLLKRKKKTSSGNWRCKKRSDKPLLLSKRRSSWKS